MKTRKHPKDLTEDEADAMVQDFDDTPEDQHRTTGSPLLTELRAAAVARRDAEGRLEAAAIAARRAGLSWGVIGAQLGMTRQGARQRFDTCSTRTGRRSERGLHSLDRPQAAEHP